MTQEAPIRVANFVDPQFVDANGVGGLNAAFGTVSGSVAALGLGVWAQGGLISPESMTLSFSGMTAAANLPSPWAVLTSGGVIVHAHGTQTGADTTNYSVNFTSLVPGSGSVTAYLAATITQIQQNPFPLVGPPQGHPSFNPNFVPSTAYATLTYSVNLAAVTGVPDNLGTFELARTTLSAGQVTVSGFSTLGWQRATPFSPRVAAPIVSGGTLTLAQSALTVLPTASGLTSTMPLAASGGGLNYRLVNPSAATVWTIAAPTGNIIGGSAGTPVTSVSVPPYGAMQLWGNAASGVWEVLGVNPLMMASLPNIFTAPQTIAVGGTSALTLSGSAVGGATLLMTGNGAVTPSKSLIVANGSFNIANDAGIPMFSLGDAGDLRLNGVITPGGANILGAATVGSGLAVSLGGIYSTGFDAGGMQIRTSTGVGPGAGFRNDGTNFYVLLSATPTGGFTAARPFIVTLATNKVTIDGTAAGTAFGGAVTIPSLTATAGTVGGVSMPGGGTVNTAGGISAGGQIVGAAIATPAGTITAGTRLRAVLGALGSGDQNAAAILADFPFTDANSGNMQFPNGVIVQWGQVQYTLNSAGTANLYNFNEAFPHNCYVVVASLGAFGPLVGNCVGAQPASLSQFFVAVSSNIGIGNVDGVYWWAIGR